MNESTLARVDGSATIRGLSLLKAGFVQAVGLAMRVAIQATTTHAKTTTLFRDQSGATRGSIRGELQSFDRGFVMAGGAAGFLQNGTQPHWIGSAVLIRGVGWRFIGRHPGTAARPFMSQARDAGAQVLHYATDEFVSAAIQRAR